MGLRGAYDEMQIYVRWQLILADVTATKTESPTSTKVLCQFEASGHCPNTDVDDIKQ
ncbi:hypothetical protein SERLA73DRAFT_179306 [Serpula lacrymans var. lacrymans S7.3]|uniref:Uncharacterized protein n=1 Tax=Serpula lacrymans var. lacrymans (strain S7.3) TaxID=936435 RepID=F8PRW1_SERL3|nr:hypothetical protein SERLA73DRAFT_179306 [Serpula lacrymans var. lacrymans S7.3]